MKDLNYKKIIENSPTAYAYHKIILDENNNPCDYVFLDVNKKFEELTGLKRENVLNKRITEVLADISEGDFDWISFYGDIAINESSAEFEKFSKPLNRWFKVKAVSPKKYYFITYFSDIEEEMQIASTEDYLDIKNNKVDFQKAANRIRKISGAKYVFFNIYETNENIFKTVSISFNRKYIQKAFSMIDVELIGLKWRPIILENRNFQDNIVSKFSSFTEVFEKVIPKNIIKNLENIFSNDDIYIVKLEKNKEIIGYYILVMEKDKEIKKRSLVRIYTEQIALIIETQKNKEKLNKTEDRLKLAMEASEHIFWDFDLDSDKIYFSSFFYKKMGYQTGKLSLKSDKIFELIHPEDNKKTLEIIDKAINNNDKFKTELRFRAKDNSWKWFLITGKTFNIDKDGIPHRIVGVSLDIDECKKQENELINMNEKLQKSIKKANEMAAKAKKANKLKSQFLANMTHEIRTPLNIIMGYTEELNKEFKGEKSSRYVESIKSAGKSLLNQVNDILDMSKIESGMIEMNYEYIDLENLIHDNTSIFKERVGKKDLDFNVEIDLLPDLVKIDESEFRQILINLLDNAVKFTKEGFVSLKVISSKDAESRNDEEKLNLSIIIEDTGIGIKEKKIEEIFNAFSQQNGQSTREYGGTGLGLAITKKLIKLLGGEISVQSRKGVGSKFKIDFFDLEYTNEKKPKIRDEHKNDGYDFSGSKILVVDDEVLNRELIKIKLSDKNIKIIEAENGSQAVEMAEKEKPDLIIMDLKMPEMDGYQALEKIRALNKSYYNLPVVALTAAATEIELNMSKASGFNDFISKPLVEGRFYEILVEYLIDE